MKKLEIQNGTHVKFENNIRKKQIFTCFIPCYAHRISCELTAINSKQHTLTL